MLSASGRVATIDNDTLRHVTAVGRVHFYKQLVDDHTFGDFQPTQKYIVHEQLLECITSHCIIAQNTLVLYYLLYYLNILITIITIIIVISIINRCR